MNHFGILKIDSRLIPNHNYIKRRQHTVKHVSAREVYKSIRIASKEMKGNFKEQIRNWYFIHNFKICKLQLPEHKSFIPLLVDGYIKTTAVQIDYDSLKRKKTSLGPLPSRHIEDDQEVYDDVAEQDEASRYVQKQIVKHIRLSPCYRLCILRP